MHAAVFDLPKSHAAKKASMSDVLKNSKRHASPPNGHCAGNDSGSATLHKAYDERSANQFEAIGSGRLTDGSPISVASAGSNPPTRRTRPLPPHARKRTASADDLLAARADDLPPRSSGGSKTPPLKSGPSGGLPTVSPLQQPSAVGASSAQPHELHSGSGRRTQSANDVLGPPRRSRFGPPKDSPPMLAALYAAAKKKEREKALASAGASGSERGGGKAAAGRGDLPLSLGDLVQWKGCDAEIPRGTTGLVSTIWNDGSGDVECVFGSKKFTFPAYRLQAIEREGPVTTSTTGEAVVSVGANDTVSGSATGAGVDGDAGADGSGNEQKEARKAMRAAKREAQRRLVRQREEHRRLTTFITPKAHFSLCALVLLGCTLLSILSPVDAPFIHYLFR